MFLIRLHTENSWHWSRLNVRQLMKWKEIEGQEKIYGRTDPKVYIADPDFKTIECKWSEEREIAIEHYYAERYYLTDTEEVRQVKGKTSVFLLLIYPFPVSLSLIIIGVGVYHNWYLGCFSLGRQVSWWDWAIRTSWTLSWWLKNWSTQKIGYSSLCICSKVPGMHLWSVRLFECCKMKIFTFHNFHFCCIISPAIVATLIGEEKVYWLKHIGEDS